MTHLFRLAVGIATLATTLGVAASAQAECYLRIDGIKGDAGGSRQSAEIAVVSWSWGLTQSGAAHVASGAGAGAADVADLKIAKALDHTTPAITKLAYAGTDVKKAVLSCRARADSPDFLVISLSGAVFISSHKYGMDRERPTEELTIHFSTATITHYNVNASGVAVEPVVATINNP